MDNKAPFRLNFSRGFKLSDGNFGNEDFTIQISADVVSKEEIDPMFDYMKNWVDGELATLITSFYERLEKQRMRK